MNDTVINKARTLSVGVKPRRDDALRAIDQLAEAVELSQLDSLNALATLYAHFLPKGKVLRQPVDWLRSVATSKAARKEIPYQYAHKISRYFVASDGHAAAIVDAEGVIAIGDGDHYVIGAKDLVPVTGLAEDDIARLRYFASTIEQVIMPHIVSLDKTLLRRHAIGALEESRIMLHGKVTPCEINGIPFSLEYLRRYALLGRHITCPCIVCEPREPAVFCPVDGVTVVLMPLA